MTTAQFQTYLTGGLGLLVVAALGVAWLLYRELDSRRQQSQNALAGVGQELKITLQRVLAELVALMDGEGAGRGSFLPTSRPQLDAVNTLMIETDRRAIAVMVAFYEELEIRKMELRAAIKNGQEHGELGQRTLETCIDGIATLFLWDEYGGAAPHEAPSTRSWFVRDWMKAHGFGAFEFSHLHLRDQVVERLRRFGMTLTPRPLTKTAHEYWSMRYDRQADPRTPFGRRRIPRSEPDAERAPTGEADMSGGGEAGNVEPLRLGDAPTQREAG